MDVNPFLMGNEIPYRSIAWTGFRPRTRLRSAILSEFRQPPPSPSHQTPGAPNLINQRRKKKIDGPKRPSPSEIHYVLCAPKHIINFSIHLTVCPSVFERSSITEVKGFAPSSEPRIPKGGVEFCFVKAFNENGTQEHALFIHKRI